MENHLIIKVVTLTVYCLYTVRVMNTVYTRAVRTHKQIRERLNRFFLHFIYTNFMKNCAGTSISVQIIYFNDHLTCGHKYFFQSICQRILLSSQCIPTNQQTCLASYNRGMDQNAIRQKYFNCKILYKLYPKSVRCSKTVTIHWPNNRHTQTMRGGTQK